MLNNELTGMNLFETKQEKKPEKQSDVATVNKTINDKDLMYATAFAEHSGSIEVGKACSQEETGSFAAMEKAELDQDLSIFAEDICKGKDKDSGGVADSCAEEKEAVVDIFNFGTIQNGLVQFADDIKDSVDDSDDEEDLDRRTDDGSTDDNESFTREFEQDDSDDDLDRVLERDDLFSPKPFILKDKLESLSAKIIGAYNTIDNMKSEDFIGFVGNALDCGFDRRKNKKMDLLFECGDLVKTGDFEFLRHGNELMLYRYTGISSRVEVPAYVANLPVCYVHTDFIYKNVFSNYKTRGHDAMYNEENIAGASRNLERSISDGIEEIVFPNTIKSIPGKCFLGCKKMTRIVIPESVVYLAPNAFDTSKVKDIYFNGPCPSGVTLYGIRGCRVHVRKEYIHTFSELRR